ncbi:zf-HC2 domain-containing protein [Kibdelosporangium aridum]|uniref:Zf-HC2 domain-containing protein n=1 Tax=Kibdelosporangium aridum TaxID=2030 RepID=A0A428ZG46_KIBAR|nr:zf-HC2 domain-containing protein [Kibdelosporangium aridum]RSM86940.1 zf-HC2 domain-containing protein [Kibdelosporangium aridum]
MTDLRGWNLPEQHLMPDAVVAFVDGELSPGARDRVAAHMMSCPCCAAEIAAQRQARAAVRAADAPSMSASLLANLRAIPQNTDLPGMPDNLAMTQEGQLVAIQRPDRVGGSRPLGSNAALGSQPRLGEGPNVIGRGRRTAQGAGVVVSGLVLGALALVAPSGAPAANGDTAPAARPKAPAHVAPVLVAPGGPILR